MNIQYILNHEGKKTGVVIPIEEWEEIKKLLQSLNKEDIESQDQHLLKGLQEAIAEVNEYKAGKAELRDLDELLNEL